MPTFKNVIAKIFVDMIIIISLLVWVIAFCIDKSHASEVWTKDTYKKHDNLVSIWFSKDMAKNIINGCKKSDKDTVRCIKILSSVMWAESSMGTRCYKNNCVGMNDWSVGYSSQMAWINAWVKKFDRYWFKQKDPSGFYRADWTKPPTRYCMWKKKDGVCKEGTKNSWNVWNKITF